MYKLFLEYAEEQRYQFANSQWIIEEAIEFHKNIYFYMLKPLTVDHNKLENS